MGAFDRGRLGKRRLLEGRALMLSIESLKKIDREIAKYPPDQKKSAVMSALIIAQDEKGWLSNETMDAGAKYLEMPAVAGYEGASFYSMYNPQPTGKYKLTLLTRPPRRPPGVLRAAGHPRAERGLR